VPSGGAVEEISISKEPFGISTVEVTAGILLEKWLAVRQKINAENLILKICEENRSSCHDRSSA
jgi:hypothetical protein